jgi:hypothetical protein
VSASIYVQACALWCPEHPDVSAWLEGKRSEPKIAEPPAELLPRRVRGRASLLTSMIAEVAARVAREGGAELATVPLIVGSAYGEMATTAQLLEMMSSDDGALSPARFQASVHNAAAGAVSIATTNRGFSSCLSAGDATSAAVLIEAFGWLSARGGQMIAVAADESLPGFFAEHERFGPLALALLLSSERGTHALARLGAPIHDAAMSGIAPALRGGTMSVPPAGWRREPGAEPFASNPVAPLLGVLRAVRSGRRASVALPAGSGSWRFEVTPDEALR